MNDPEFSKWEECVQFFGDPSLKINLENKATASSSANSKQANLGRSRNPYRGHGAVFTSESALTALGKPDFDVDVFVNSEFSKHDSFY